MRVGILWVLSYYHILWPYTRLDECWLPWLIYACDTVYLLMLLKLFWTSVMSHVNLSRFHSHVNVSGTFLVWLQDQI
jgi:hypothetical protein